MSYLINMILRKKTTNLRDIGLQRTQRQFLHIFLKSNGFLLPFLLAIGTRI